MPLSVANGDLLEFKLQGFYNNAAEVNNVFHYRVVTNGGATLDQFAAGLWFGLNADVQPRTNAIVVYDKIDAKILDADALLVNGETYLVPSSQGAGGEGADALPPESCWTFKLLRPSGSFRHGFKRFAGVSEAAQANGFPTSGVVTSLNTIATLLATALQAYSIGSGGAPDAPVAGSSMQPVIVQKIINGDLISPVNIGVVTAAVFDKIGTQNTRKFGRGS